VQNSVATYLPLLTSAISLCTALAVAFIGFRLSRSVEAGKVRASYLNYALQKLMDEYVTYDPVIDLSDGENVDYVRLIENRFDECRASIRRVSPLIGPTALTFLHEIELKYSDIINRQANAKLSGQDAEVVSVDDYATMLTDYVNYGQTMLRQQIESLRARLEEGN
jgi:hypothetical protein